MSSYITTTGDTFELIARKQYGTETESNRIAQANPGAIEPFSPGLLLTIPAIPNAPQDVPTATPADNPDEVSVNIDGTRFRFWDSIRLTRSIDAMDVIEFGAPFDAAAPGFKDTFQPFSFKPLSVFVGGVPLFSGTMVTVDPVLAADKKTLVISGYSLPGVLNDCTPTAAALDKVESNNQTLKEIATTLTAPFGLSVEFEGDPGPVFERVHVGASKKVLASLTDLAKQRNFIISSTSQGALLFLKSTSGGQPVARLAQGDSPLLSVTPQFNPQDYYSHVTGIAPQLVGLPSAGFTVKNPFLSGVFRPFTFTAPDTENSNVKKAVEAKHGRMFGSMASYSAQVVTWRDPSGRLWEPNTTIKLLAPDAMVYSEYEFVVRSVTFERTRASEIAVLELVIPGSFSGEIPEALPWAV